jgi:hypothetical protein
MAAPSVLMGGVISPGSLSKGKVAMVCQDRLH